MAEAEESTTLIRAAWLATMDRPIIRDGGVAIAGGRIAGVGPWREIARDHPDALVHDAGEAIILPGLVNAHTHLELSHIERQASPTAGGFVQWVLDLRARLGVAIAAAPGGADDVVPAAVAAGVAQCRRFGVTCVGDVAFNASLVRGVLRDSPLNGVSFGEVLGMAGRSAQLDGLLSAATDRTFERDGLRAGIEAHAPYSLDLAGYRRCVAAAKRFGLPIATHLAETQDEAEFLASHSGPFRALWDALGAWSDGAGVSRVEGGPIRAMHAIGLLDLPTPTVLAHVNYCDDAEMELLARGRASVAYCPRTHAWFGHPPHHWREMLARGINVAVGTDSCASSPDLNLVDDLRLMHRTAPDVPPETLWAMATIRGARALGMEAALGTLAVGKLADCVVFAVRGEDPMRFVLENAVMPAEMWSRGERVSN